MKFDEADEPDRQNMLVHELSFNEMLVMRIKKDIEAMMKPSE